MFYFNVFYLLVKHGQSIANYDNASIFLWICIFLYITTNVSKKQCIIEKGVRIFSLENNLNVYKNSINGLAAFKQNLF